MSEQFLYNLIPHEMAVSANLELRLLVPNDASRLLEIFQADPDIQNKVTWTSGLKTIKDVQATIKKLTGNDEVLFAIAYDEKLVGYIGIWKDDGWFGVLHPDDYAFGYFCDPTWRGRGVITDAAKALMFNVESVVRVKTFSIYTEDSNLASQAVVKKLGFKPTDEVYEEPVLGSVERRHIREVTPTQ